MATEWECGKKEGLQIARGAKFFVKSGDGEACGPVRWATLKEWLALGYFTPQDEVRRADETMWNRIGAMPEWLAASPADTPDEALSALAARAREKKVVGPRAAAYLQQLGCPVPLERLNPYTAFHWVRILEELRPPVANANEHWAAEEEANGRVPSASADDATAEQRESLRTKGVPVPDKLSRLEAQRLISGPPTEEQLERLKFYGLTLPVGASKDEARDLIERTMRDNWGSEEAFQASARSQGAPGADGQTASPPLRLRQAPVAPDAVFGSKAAARSLAEAQAPTSPRRRPVGPIYVVAACLVALVISGWAIARKKPASDAARVSSSVSESAAASVRPPVGVTLLEAPNPANGEQLRLVVTELLLTGIVAGTEPRALIDGRLYRVGDVVDRARGLVILQIEPKRNLVAFGDAAGGIVHRVIE